MPRLVLGSKAFRCHHCWLELRRPFCILCLRSVSAREPRRGPLDILRIHVFLEDEQRADADVDFLHAANRAVGAMDCRLPG